MESGSLKLLGATVGSFFMKYERLGGPTEPKNEPHPGNNYYWEGGTTQFLTKTKPNFCNL